MTIVPKAKELAILERSFLSAGLTRLAGIFGRVNHAGKQTQTNGKFDLPRVENPVAVVGDIHGRLDLLDLLLDKLAQEASAANLIFVGDYVDRGPDARAVIDRLRALGDDAVCLKGNHEAMLLEFLDDPIEWGGRWLRNGGDRTLASYGIVLSENSSVDDVMAASSALRIALADGAETWLRGLPLFWQSGTLLVTHAGPDPAMPIEGQDDRVFLWGHDRFLRNMRSDGLWVAHGHWIRERPSCADRRIAVDTGAWATGWLTAAVIGLDGSVRFVATA